MRRQIRPCSGVDKRRRKLWPRRRSKHRVMNPVGQILEKLIFENVRLRKSFPAFSGTAFRFESTTGIGFGDSEIVPVLPSTGVHVDVDVCRVIGLIRK